jgi:trigger factor
VAVAEAELAQALLKLQDSMAQLVPKGESGEKERQVPPLDQEWAKDLGFKTLEELKAHVEAKLREQKRALQEQRMESALYEELLKRHTFEVPARLVSHQTERLTNEFKARLMLSGVPEAQVSQEMARFTDELRTTAVARVKLGFILERVAEQERVTVTQDELVGRLWQLAQRWGKDPAEVRRIFDAQGLWPSVVSTLRQAKQ